MKPTKLLAALLATTVLIASAATCRAQTCADGSLYDEKKVSAAIDRYFANPFGAIAWRVLNGIGDPGLDASSVEENRWDNEGEWRKLVAKIAPGSAQQQYLGYNCRIGYALATLKSRIARFGEASPYVHQWISVQSAVLRACTNNDATTDLPPVLSIEAGASEAALTRQLQEQDRAYQQASLDFYLARMDTAIAEYRTIAAGTGPHRSSARYMIANALANAKRLEEANSEINAILADANFKDVHAIAQELRGYVAHLADSRAEWSELISSTFAILEKPAAEISASDKFVRDYRRALNDVDFLGLRAQNTDWWLTGKLPENPTLSQAVYDAEHRYPIAPWLMAGQAINELHQSAGFQVIGAAWREKVTAYSAAAKAMAGAERALGLAWQVFDAEAANSQTTDAASIASRLPAVAEATRSSCGNAPETAAAGTLLYHVVRLLTERGDFAGAYQTLDAFPFKGTYTFNRTVLRLGQYLLGKGLLEEGRRYRAKFLTIETYERLETLPAGDEFKLDFPRLEALLAENQETWRKAILRRTQPADDPLINLFPASSLSEMAALEEFPEQTRALFARVSWTRLYVQGQVPTASETLRMLKLNPAIQPVVDEVNRAYPKIDDTQRWLLTILRTPRFGILTTASGSWDMLDLADDTSPPTQLDQFDHNDKNWWCPFNLDRHLGEVRDDFDELTGNAAARALTLSGGFNVSGHWFRNDAWFQSVLDADTAKSLAAAREMVLHSHPMVAKIDWKEINRLARVSSAPRMLTERAVQWARRGGQPREGVTEALALSVRTARYGCSWAGSHRAYTQAAVGILRTMFSDSEWARKTPYWYDCLWQSYGSDPNSTTKIPSCQGPKWLKQKPLR